jgi:hypothetical protein
MLEAEKSYLKQYNNNNNNLFQIPNACYIAKLIKRAAMSGYLKHIVE